MIQDDFKGPKHPQDFCKIHPQEMEGIQKFNSTKSMTCSQTGCPCKKDHFNKGQQNTCEHSEGEASAGEMRDTEHSSTCCLGLSIV